MNTILYFDEACHKYTDNENNLYISTTTLISKYEKKQDFSQIALACERIGRNPRHPKYNKYKNKSKAQIEKEWDKITEIALIDGNEKHNYLEDAVKSANGYKRVGEERYINDRIYTISDILDNHNYGRIDIDFFVKTGIKDRYPQIFELIRFFVEQGYRIYSEIGTFSVNYLISGLIDLLLVKGDRFYIIDWKTNRADIKFESGYFEKDTSGNLTDNFIYTRDYFLPPLHYLEASVGNKYTLQLSMYDYLTEQFGLTCLGNILCHIRKTDYSEFDEVVIKNPQLELYGKQRVDFLPIKYLKDDIIRMVEDYKSNRPNEQLKMRLQ